MAIVFLMTFIPMAKVFVYEVAERPGWQPVLYFIGLVGYGLSAAYFISEV